MVNILILLIVVGIVLYVINNYVPMDDKIKKILNWVVVGGVIIYLVKAFNVIGWLNSLL